ncbi:Gpatch3 [Symbiodinium natans]|uniref:Gpatch3 protein n=1 Tax=Symbiodinium natans TaxID=878477 RepID=A0A812QRV3_9DINO|nr:Gpatch3 [Symbiodinium natans]
MLKAMAETPLLLVQGIPEQLHVPDLRAFFKPAVEKELFSCFHFRRGRGTAARGLTCLARAASQDAAVKVISGYHGVPWKEVLVDAAVPRAARCLISWAPSETKRTDVWELNPPPALPKGNVGTSRSAILSAIRRCTLPPSVVKRLGIAPACRLRSTRDFAAIPPPLAWRAGQEGAVPGARRALAASPPHEARGADSQNPVTAMFAALRGRKRPKAQCQAKAEAKEAEAQKEQPGKRSRSGAQSPKLRRQMMCAHEEGGSSDSEHNEGRHLPLPLDDDDLPMPIEKAPHYERNDRLDSAAGYLYEDTVEHIWDKQDASGLVWYTDAAYWDRLAGDLDERCADAWDVDSESREVSSDEDMPPEAPAMEQGVGLLAVQHGVAGKIMRSWGADPSVKRPSSTLLAVVEGLQPNLSRTGLGWAGESRRKTSAPRSSSDDWLHIGSKYDSHHEDMKRRESSCAKPLPGSFSASALAEDRRLRVHFVPAQHVEKRARKGNARRNEGMSRTEPD